MQEKVFLFSVDLEDVRLMVPDGRRYTPAVPRTTHLYLNWLQKHKARCTFFVVGQVAEQYPELIKEIVSEGHEIALHTFAHIPLTEQQPQTFAADLQRNLQSLRACGVNTVYGFRAPTFSLTRQSSWAYDVLHQAGIRYSTSVYPAANPLFGWPEANPQPHRLPIGIIEIPMTLAKVGPLCLAFGGGVYFRVLPMPLISYFANRFAGTGKPVLGYFHPYDADTQQERFMHPGLHNNPWMNRLMYVGRSRLFEKLDRLMHQGFRIQTYQSYITSNLHHLQAEPK